MTSEIDYLKELDTKNPKISLSVHDSWTHFFDFKNEKLQQAIDQLWKEEEPKLYLPFWFESLELSNEKDLNVCLQLMKEALEEKESCFSIEEGWLFLKKFERRCLRFLKDVRDRFSYKKERIFFEGFEINGLRQKQLEAVKAALICPFFVLTGGPGTGKTYTCRRLVEAVVKSEKKDRLWRVALLAPTGKAMVRLKQSMKGLDEVCDLKLEAMTIHRFLMNQTNRFLDICQEEDPAAYDMVLVDEASMVTMTLFENLLLKIHAKTRLVFIGDPYQLPPVGSMPVFETIAKMAKEAGFCVHLDECLRIETPLLYKAAQTLSLARESDQKESFKKLFNLDCQAALQMESFKYCASWIESIADRFPWKILCEEDSSPETVFQITHRWVCLCNIKDGAMGCDRLNQAIYEFLRFELMKNKKAKKIWIPVMATVNQQELARVNGEMGLVSLDENVVRSTPFLSKAIDKAAEVLFFDEMGQIKRISPLRLNTLVPGWAMTVHKSQGSEFDHVECLLSSSVDMKDSSLLYTACTRAKKSLRLWTKDNRWEEGLSPAIASLSWMDFCKKKTEQA